jgi:hypothetical protein
LQKLLPYWMPSLTRGPAWVRSFVTPSEPVAGVADVGLKTHGKSGHGSSYSGFSDRM